LSAAPPPFGYYDAPGTVASAEPRVIVWYRIYCLVCALFYVACIVVLSFTTSPREVGGTGLSGSVMLCLVMAPFVMFYGFAAFIPRRPWAWVLGLVAIAFSMLMGLGPFGIVILVFWLKPVTQAAFGRFRPG
jgi:hypothetical protein